MAKPTVFVKFDIEKLLPTLLDKDTAKDIFQAVKEMSIDSMGKGLSPVKGQGRFAGYKNPDKYPGRKNNVHGIPKNKRPVNLKLTGDLWDSLGFKLEKNKIVYGILQENAEGDVLDYAEVHNDGNKNTSKRSFVPNKNGEEFLVSIMNEIKAIIAQRLDFIIKLSNK